MTDHEQFLKDNRVPKGLLLLDALIAIAYLIMIAFFFERGELILFWILIVGEVFHLWQALTFIHAIWETEFEYPKDDTFLPPVDVFVTVAGEPMDILEKTIRAAKKMDYPNFHIYILNDGFVAKKENWQDPERLAKKLNVNCITRRIPGGAKAGNINHALLMTRSPFIAVFDMDHIPEKNFLRETVPYFVNRELGFVQTPQFYRDQETNHITRGAWEQQALFFGAICKGKNRMNAVTMCGTNMVLRRQALEEVGGINEESIAEDFVTGFMMHQREWRSLYIPKVLARGLAPQDFLSYYKQQARWARGSLDLIFRHNLLFARGLTWQQRLQYLASVSYFFSGWVIIADALIPLAYFATGLYPIHTATMAIATVFLPYMVLMLYTIERASNFSFGSKGLAFSMASFPIHMQASIDSFFRKKSSFSITAKKAASGNFISLATPQIIYLVVAGAGATYSGITNGFNTAWAANVAWALLNVMIFGQFVHAASPQGSLVENPAQVPEPITTQQLLPARIPMPEPAYAKIQDIDENER